MAQASTEIPQRVLHGALGPLLIGTWLNTALFSFEVTQVYRYFAAHPLFSRGRARHPNGSANVHRPDLAWTPMVVLWMFGLDIVSSGVGCALTYTYTVTGWGNTAMLLSNDWMMSFFGIASALSTFSMHLFLITRFYTLSRASTISSILCVLALMACGLYIFLSISLITLFRHLADRPKMQTVITVWAVDTASTDCLIAGTLMWYLFKTRATIDDSQGSARMLTRLIRISGLSGAAPAFLALLTFIGYLSAKETNLAFMFSLSSGRAGTLSVLYNLNSRDGLTRNTHRASAAATAIYLDTTLEPGQMFGRALESQSVTPAGKDRVLDSSGQVVLSVVDHTSLVDSGYGSDSKQTIDIGRSFGDAEQRMGLVRMSLPRRVSITLEGGVDVALRAAHELDDGKNQWRPFLPSLPYRS